MSTSVSFLAPLAFAFAVPSTDAPVSDPPADTGSESREVLDEMAPSVVFALTSQSPEIDDMVIPILQEMLEPGPFVERWSETGIDIRKRVAEFEAEHGSAYLAEQDGTGLYVFYAGEPRQILGDTYTRHRLIEGGGIGFQEAGLMQILPDAWLEMLSAVEFVGNAQCSAGIIQIDLLTERPLSAWSDEEIGMGALVYSLMTKLTDAEICLVYEEADEHGFPSTAYTRDGNRLEVLSAQSDITRIVDASTLESLIADTRQAGLSF